jgi:hypothetical protein
MKTFLSLLSLLSLAGLLSITGCASENQQGGSYESMESNHGHYASPQTPPPGVPRGDYWARDYPY